MPAEPVNAAARLRELAAAFAVSAPQAVEELSGLADLAERSGATQRRQILRQVELLAHRLNGRAAIYESPALSARAAAVETAAAGMLAGAMPGNGRLPELCRALAAALPAGGKALNGALGAP